MEPSSGSQEELEEVVANLRSLRSRRGLQAVHQIGKLVIDSLYGGDIRKWQDRPKSDPDYVRLETHPGLPISSSGLYRSLRVFELGTQYPALLRSTVLTLSHVL